MNRLQFWLCQSTFPPSLDASDGSIVSPAGSMAKAMLILMVTSSNPKGCNSYKMHLLYGVYMIFLSVFFSFRILGEKITSMC